MTPPTARPWTTRPASPSPAAGALVAWTGYAKAPTLDPAPTYRVVLDNRTLAGDRRAIAVDPALALTRGGDPLVAFQDHGHGIGAIRLSAGGRTRTVSRSGANQWRPALAVAGGRAVVAWEDGRGRRAQVRVARARVSALR